MGRRIRSPSPPPLKTDRTFRYHRKIFSGWVESPAIGIGAIGFDIDDSDWWVKKEDDIRKVTDVIGAAAVKTRAPSLGAIIKAMPEAVDFFRGLAKDDEVVRWAPMCRSMYSGRAIRARRYSSRARGPPARVAGLSISNWNYSVEFTVTWQAPYPLFATSAPVTLTSVLHSDSTLQE